MGHQTRDRGKVLLAGTPTSQWLSRENQQNSPLHSQKEVRAHKREWAEEVPGVLWMYRTTVQNPNVEIPFALTYINEAVILVKIRMPKFRV